MSTQVIAVFNYLNDDHVRAALEISREALFHEFAYAEKHANLPGLEAIWREFEEDYNAKIALTAIEFLTRSMIMARVKLGDKQFANPAVTALLSQGSELQKLFRDVRIKP